MEWIAFALCGNNRDEQMNGEDIQDKHRWKRFAVPYPHS